MDSKQQAAIERLRELEANVTPGEWEPLGHYCTETDISFACAFCNETLPLIEALAAENERLQEERDLLSEMLSDSQIDRANKSDVIESITAENERLRVGIKDMAQKYAGLENVKNHIYSEKEDVETALHFAQSERDALQARIDGALRYLDYSKVNLAIAREAIEILKGETND